MWGYIRDSPRKRSGAATVHGGEAPPMRGKLCGLSTCRQWKDRR